MDYNFPEDILTNEEKITHLEEILKNAPAGYLTDQESTWFSIKNALDRLKNSLS